MSVTRLALIALTAVVLLAFAACSPATNHNAAGNGNSPKPAANTNGVNVNAANANAAPKSKPGTGSIEVTSVPPGAGITLVPTAEDSAGTPQAYGLTPATITDLAPGKYTVSLTKTGYKSFQREVEVKANAAVQVKAALKP
ncbi:MAG TPA: PEGA domain-containing protein [Blastocatellia bacterium]|nr:PEGA domain-containing protein [Blastocatellia bacterium]